MQNRKESNFMYQYDTYCGLYCGACTIKKANEDGTLNELAREWEEDPNSLVCEGCKGKVTCHYCIGCPIQLCNREKGLEHCGQCPDFPCERLRAFDADKYAHHTGVIRNLVAKREISTEEWLEGQAKRWRCEKCGARFTWYDEFCLNCGAPLYNSVKEEEYIKIARPK
jgi:hypothetical protein